MKRIIKQWSRRNLSIYGKILIAKTYIISQFIYTLQSIGLPERVLSSINHTLYTFIWKKKNSNKKAFEKVKRKVLMQDYDKGGLKMIDMKILQSALYLSWIPKLITKSTDKWKVFPKIYYSQLGEGLSILHTPCVLKDLMGYPRKEGEFWKNVLDNWIQVRKSAWSGTKQLNLNSALWNNNNFQYKNRNLHLKEWMTAGIFKIKHIINEHKQMITLQDLENKIATSACRQFEYNAVKSAFENACSKGILDLENEDYDHNIAKLTLNDKPLESYTVKNFRQTLTPESQPCATNFWKKEIKHRH